MSDKVELRVAGLKIENFKSYSITSSLYTAGDAFNMEFAQPEVRVSGGMRCEVYVNDALELTGIIDKDTRGGDKSGNTLRIEGRDLTGLLIDSCVEDFVDLDDISLQGLTKLLLKKVPFINRKNIVFAKGHAAAGDDESGTPPKLEPGETIFDALRKFALARGLLFFSYPDGTLVFGKPLSKGKAEFQLTRLKATDDTNVLKGECTNDLSKRFSKINVIGQQDGSDPEDVNVEAVVSDPTFPFYKPLVLNMNHDGDSPARFGRMTLDRQRSEGFQLSYEVAGFSQQGKNWGINRMCNIEDDVTEVRGTYLIYGRTFEQNKEGGRTTKLHLGYPGV